jgi:hypothetical protein
LPFFEKEKEKEKEITIPAADNFYTANSEFTAAIKYSATSIYILIYLPM